MNKKLLIIGGAIIVLLGVVIAYGFKPKCPDPADNIPGTEAFRSDCPVAGAEVTDQDNTLDLWVVYDNTEAFNGQIQAFESQNQGVKVNIKKFTNLEEYEDLIVNEIAEGKGPDVFMIQNSWITKHAGKLYPLPLNQNILMTPDMFRETFFQAAADDLIVNGQIYGMPLSIDNLAIFYNKQQFSDLIATTDSPASLWDGIREQVINLTERDNSAQGFTLSGLALGRADNISSAVDILYALMLQYGVQFYDETEENATFANSVPGNNGFAKPGVKALEFFTSFALPDYQNYSWNQNITGAAPDDKELGPFASGRTTMIIGYPYLYQNIQTAIQNAQRLGSKHIDLKDVGVAPFPQLAEPGEAGKRDTYASYFPLVVARTSDKPALAWSLVQFLTSADSLQTYHQLTNRPTSRKDMVTDQSIEPLFGTFAYQAPFAKSFKIYDEAAYRKVFSDAIQLVAKNLETPDQALTEAQQKITCIMKKQKGLLDVETDCQI